MNSHRPRLPALALLIFLAGAMILPLARAAEPLYVNLDSFNPQENMFNLNSIESAPQEGNGTMTINLSSTEEDIDESRKIVEITVSGILGGQLPAGSLCTRWDIYSLEKKQSQVLCHGDEQCCMERVALPDSREVRDDDKQHRLCPACPARR